MIQLEKIDKETGSLIELPFYLIEDSSMINTAVFRGLSNTQYSVLNLNTFRECRDKLITQDEIRAKRLTAEMDEFQNTLSWHCQYVDGLWRVYHMKDFGHPLCNENSEFIGYFSGPSVRGFLPKTYEQFQGKRDELTRSEREFYKPVESALDSERLVPTSF